MESTLQELTGDALADMAETALAAEELPTAIALFDRAEPDVADPDRCAGGRWMAYMLAGNYQAAWEESDAIRRRGAPDPHRFWNGEELRDRRLILRSLHGFGDAVQMFRFLPQLQSIVSELIVEVPPRLLELAPCFDGIGRVITWGEGARSSTPMWDVQMEVMELPYALRVSAADLTPQQGYLHLPQAQRVRVAEVLGRRALPRVGVVWGAGTWNTSRSIAFAEFRALLDVDGVEFWNLQGEPEHGAWLVRRRDKPCRDVYECGDGIATLAAVIEQLDLVITVDTLAAHLAGALGVSCWLLLQHRADWRWMSGRENSPWYPSLRLMRQTQAGDWAGLLRQVRQELDAKVWEKGS